MWNAQELLLKTKVIGQVSALSMEGKKSIFECILQIIYISNLISGLGNEEGIDQTTQIISKYVEIQRTIFKCLYSIFYQKFSQYRLF